MKNFKIFLTSLIWLLLLTSLASAYDEWWNLSWHNRQMLTISNIRFPTLILLDTTSSSCAFPDCRDYRVVDDQGRVIPHGFIDVDKDDIPEHILFVTNMDLDLYNQPSRINISNSTPRVKYEDYPLINSWGWCYQKENITLCKGEDMKDEIDIIYLKKLVRIIDLKNRLDLYTYLKFNVSPVVTYFCPLVLDLDIWPQAEIILFTDPARENEIGVTLDEIRKGEYLPNGNVIEFQREVNGEWVCDGKYAAYRENFLIFIGKNKTIIVTKPSTYFFKKEILLNGNIQVSVCTNDRQAHFLPPNGPAAYIFFEEQKPEKLLEFIDYFNNLPTPILYPQESVEIVFIEGRVWPWELTLPEIVPLIKFESEFTEFPSTLNFTWTTQEEVRTKSILHEEGMLVFEEPISLESSRWKYPFDTYEAWIYNITPPIIQDKTSELSFKPKEPYEGEVKFENNKISFIVRRKGGSKFRYFIFLFFSIVVFVVATKVIKHMKKQSFQPRKLLTLSSHIIPVLIIIFLSKVDVFFSVGSLPYLFMWVYLIRSLYLKWRKLKKPYSKKS